MAEKSQKQKANVVKDMLAGGAAGCLEVTVMYPTEFIKTQLQLQTKGAKLYNGMWDCTVSCPLPVAGVAFISSCAPQVKTVQEKGVKGLYRGLSSLLLGTAPKASIRFATFSQVSKFLQVASFILLLPPFIFPP